MWNMQWNPERSERTHGYPAIPKAFRSSIKSLPLLAQKKYDNRVSMKPFLSSPGLLLLLLWLLVVGCCLLVVGCWVMFVVCVCCCRCRYRCSCFCFLLLLVLLLLMLLMLLLLMLLLLLLVLLLLLLLLSSSSFARFWVCADSWKLFHLATEAFH